MTAISERKLMELRQRGIRDGGNKFVDPSMLRRCTMVLARRGEQWAQSVLGRDISARSLLVPTAPALRSGEEYTLVYADEEETFLALERSGLADE